MGFITIENKNQLLVTELFPYFVCGMYSSQQECVKHVLFLMTICKYMYFVSFHIFMVSPQITNARFSYRYVLTWILEPMNAHHALIQPKKICIEMEGAVHAAPTKTHIEKWLCFLGVFIHLFWECNFSPEVT